MRGSVKDIEDTKESSIPSFGGLSKQYAVSHGSKSVSKIRGDWRQSFPHDLLVSKSIVNRGGKSVRTTLLVVRWSESLSARLLDNPRSDLCVFVRLGSKFLSLN